MKETKPLLYLDDDADNCEMIRLLLAPSGYKIIDCARPEECLEQLENDDFSAVILDSKLDLEAGLEKFQKIRNSNSGIPVIIFTADARPAAREAFLTAGASAFFVKPNDLDNLIETIRQLLPAPS